MTDRKAGRAVPGLRDVQYEAESIVAVTAAGIRRRQRTAYTEMWAASGERLEMARTRNHATLVCADGLRVAYEAVREAMRRVSDRIEQIDAARLEIERLLETDSRLDPEGGASPATPTSPKAPMPVAVPDPPLAPSPEEELGRAA